MSNVHCRMSNQGMLSIIFAKNSRAKPPARRGCSAYASESDILFKFHPAINLGVCGGARTSTASVAMVGDVAKSDVPMLGYTVPYAVSNTLLTLWGMVIVLMY